MNKKIIILSSLLLFSLTNQSCRNDFLDVKPTEAISTDDLSLLNNDAGARASLLLLMQNISIGI